MENFSQLLDENGLAEITRMFQGPDDSLISTRVNILHRFLHTLKSSRNSINRDLILEAIGNCLNHLNDEFLYPDILNTVILIICHCDCTSLYASRLVTFVLKNEFIQRHFIHDCDEFLDMLKMVVVNINDVRDPGDITCTIHEDILKCVCYLSQHVLRPSYFRARFISELLEPLLKFAMKFNLEDSSNRYTLIKNCLIQVLFFHPEDRRLSNANNDVKINDDCDDDVMKLIERCTGRFTRDDVLAEFYVLFFDALVATGSDSNELYRYLIAIFRFLDLLLIRKTFDSDDVFTWKVESRKRPRELQQRQAIVLNRLLTIFFDKYRLPTCVKLENDINVETRKLFSDLAKIVIMSGRLRDELHSNWLIVLRRTIILYPTMVTDDDFYRLFIECVMLKRKHDRALYEIYTELCVIVVNVYVRTHRLDEFIVVTTRTIKNLLTTVSIDELPNDKTQILPFDLYELLIENLFVTNNVALFRLLIRNVQDDCVAILENGQTVDVSADLRSILMMELVTSLLLNIMKKALVGSGMLRITPKKLFVDTTDELQQLIRRFGLGIIENKHNSRIMKQFLDLCVIWGDIRLAMRQYDRADEQITIDVNQAISKIATNFECLHPYISGPVWKTIAQRVVNFGDEECLNLTSDLVLQKLQSLRSIYNATLTIDVVNSATKSCVHYLLTKSTLSWIRNQAILIKSFLTVHDTLCLAKSLVAYYVEDGVDYTMIDQHLFIEDRALTVATILETFRYIGEQLFKCRAEHISVALTALDFIEIITFEVNGENTGNLKSYYAILGKLVSDRFNSAAMSDCNIDITNCFRLLFKLPVKYLRSEFRIILAHLGFMLLADINSSCSQNDLPRILTFLEDVIGDISLPMSFKTKEIFNWGTQINCSRSDRRSLYRLLFYVNDYAFKSKFVNNMLIRNNYTIDEFPNVIDVAVSGITCTAKAIQLNKKVEWDEKNPSSKCYESTVANCYECLKSILTILLSRNNASIDLNQELYVPYTTVMSFALEKLDQPLIASLAPFLESVLSYVRVNNTDKIIVRPFLEKLITKGGQIETISRFSFISLMSILVDYVDVNQITNINNRLLQFGPSEDYFSLMNDSLDALSKILDSNRRIEDKDLYLTKIRWMRFTRFPIVSPAADTIDVTQFERNYETFSSSIVDKIRTFLLHYDRSIENPLVLDFIPSVVRSVLQLLVIIFENDTIQLSSDLLMVTLLLVRFSIRIASTILDGIEVLLVIYITHSKMLLEYTSQVCGLYKKIFEKLVKMSEKNENYEELPKQFLACANKMEKLTDKLTSNKETFKPVAVYQLYDLVDVYYSQPVSKCSSKIYLKNILFYWIRLVDRRSYKYAAITMPHHMNVALSDLLSEYERYFKFVGKA